MRPSRDLLTWVHLSPGNDLRASVLEVKDNKVARGQDKLYTAIGRPGQLIRRDGLGTWEELPKETKVALGRLDAIFDTEKLLYTNMSLPTHFVLAVSNRIDSFGSLNASSRGGTSRSVNKSSPRTPRIPTSQAGARASVSVSVSIEMH